MDFHLLGPLEVSDGGEPLELGGAKQRALLAVLLLNGGEAVSADSLIEALWGDTAPASALNSVHIYVSQLRKALGDGRLVTQRRGYRLLLEPDELDVERFEQLLAEGRELRAQGKAEEASEALRSALALWRGPALADFTYEPFAQTEIARLEEQRLAALEERIEADLALGRQAEIVSELEALVRDHPLRERLRGQLMLALYRSGRQAEALDVYQEGRKLLSTELGLEPGLALKELEQGILNQDPALTAPAVVLEPAVVLRRPGPLLVALGAAAILLAIGTVVLAETRGGGAGGLASVSANAVAEIDPATNRIVAQVPVGARPGMIANGDGALWVANLDDRTVSRVDLRTKSLVRTIAVDAVPTGLVVQGNRVWVATSASKVSTIDTRYNRVAPVARLGQTFAMFPRRDHPETAGFGSVWVSDRMGVVTRFGPAASRNSTRVITGQGASGIAAGESAVWVANTDDGTVSRIDPTNVVTETIPVGHSPTAVAVGAGSVWVTLPLEGLLVRLDPRTNSVVARIALGRHPQSVVATADAVWVADPQTGQVHRVDPQTNRVAKTIAVGNSPNGLAVADGSIWVTVAPFPTAPTLPRGGTLEVEVEVDPGPLDPALASPFSSQLLYVTCAKLLNYADEPTPGGAQLRPEVAQAFPQRSADGRTYTFTIRPGFRFSPPSNEPVTARTFKESIERLADPRTKSYAGSYLADVVGAKAFSAGHAKEITGIVARGDRLDFHLIGPSGSLPARLAMPVFCAVPRGTPPDPDGIQDLPSAGPYYVASHLPGRRLVLMRNPNYHGERPQRPAVIRVTIGIGGDREVADVEAGRADYAAGGAPAEDRARLSREYGKGASGGQRYFENTSASVRYLALNTSRPLFADENMRRAVSYAVDRAALAAQHRRFFQALTFTGGGPTAEYLPPALRISDARLYPTRPAVARARKLVAGRKGTAVFYTCNEPPCPQQAAIVKRDLARIGIDVVVQQLPKPVMFTRASRPGAPFDIILLGWTPDYFDPSGMLSILSGPILPKDNANFSYFDDPRFNRRLAAADRLTGPSRFQAYDRLARDLARAAPIVAYANDASHDFFSARVGCQVYNPVYGIDLAALCIRHRRS